MNIHITGRSATSYGSFFGRLRKPLLLISIAFLGACKPKEISVVYDTLVLRENTSIFAIDPKDCVVLFDVDNKNTDPIDHLGFRLTVFDRNAADREWQNSMGQILGMQSSPSSSSAEPFTHSQNIRFKNLASGKSKLSANFPQAACDKSFTVVMRGFSCRIGENDCAEAILAKEYSR